MKGTRKEGRRERVEREWTENKKNWGREKHQMKENLGNTSDKREDYVILCLII